MDPSHDVDRILKDWDSVTSQARPPAVPPLRPVVRSGLAGSTLAGAALIVVAVVVAGIWLGRPGPDGGVGSVPSASAGSSPTTAATATPAVTATAPATPSSTPVPSVAIETPTPTPTVSAAPSIGPCDPADLPVRITLWEGAAGHRIAHLELSNAGSVRCTVKTEARPQLVDGHGSVLIDGTNPTTSRSLTVAPGHVLKTLVQDGNYCGPDPVAPVSVALVLTGGGRIVATPVSPTDIDGVPPCNGAAGSAGDIEMQPWAS
jgi:hypothetical protein